LITESPHAAPGGLEVMTLDRGQGMANPALCFQDGFSTAGSSGTGMGAIRRLSSSCEVYSVPGKGTVLLVRFEAPGQAALNSGFQYAGVSVPHPAETQCGDAFAVHEGRGHVTALVVDGLGHGPSAADSARAAVAAFRVAPDQPPGEIMIRIHGALRATRGAAAGVARLDFQSRQVIYAGVGNVMGMIYDLPKPRQMVCNPGTLGQGTARVKEFSYPWNEKNLVLLYSDGISTHWPAEMYANALQHDPAVLAGVIYRDHRRQHDDATVLALRERTAG
jgi:hypothetical protein